MGTNCYYFITLFLTFVCFLNCDYLGSYFMFIPGKKFNRSILEELTFSSRLYCLSTCLEINNCRGVAWNSISKSCQLGSVDIMHEAVVNKHMVDNPAYFAYGKVRYPVHLVQKEGQSNMIFEEAEERCRSKGSSIATSTDIKQAQELGMHRCNCGWIASGINVGVLQDREHNCTIVENEEGLAQCDKVTAGVWCRF